MKSHLEFVQPLRAPFEQMPLEALLAIHTTFMRSPEDSVHAAFIADIIRSRNEAAR